ncbi:MAG TPA: aminotransferase class IV [Gemmatimonadaceae bacterium]|nr:aminotransferase class IV [Gemmatimonadaceae bacterium]
MSVPRRTPAVPAPAAPATAGPAPLVWVNGRPADPGAPQLLAGDRGFTLADGLFETMRAYGGTVFRLGRHLERLERGAQRLGIPLPPGLRAAVTAATRTAAAGGLREASVRLTVSRGPAPPGAVPPDEPSPTVVLAVHPVPRPPIAWWERGLAARLVAGRRNEHAVTAGLKTLAYTDAVAALVEARAHGADEALFLDTAGHLCEASASNVFLWARRALVTPPVHCGALPGVTREATLALAVDLDLAVEERAILPEELFAAEEAFLTSSVRELVPLTRVDGRAIGAGVPGPVTRRLAEAYAALVRRECVPA